MFAWGPKNYSYPTEAIIPHVQSLLARLAALNTFNRLVTARQLTADAPISLLTYGITPFRCQSLSVESYADERVLRSDTIA